MGKRTVREYVSGHLCWPIVPERLQISLFCLSTSYGGLQDAVGYPRKGQNHSHSIVPGGLLVTSYTTRLTPPTSLMMRVAARARKLISKRKKSAVMPSTEVTARSATT